MSLNQTQLIKHIDGLLNFLSPAHLRLANCHMVDYFTNSCFIEYIPKEIQQEITNIGDGKVIDMIFNNNLAHAPNLAEFIADSSKFTLKNSPNLCLSSEEFIEKLRSWGSGPIKKLKLDIFMTPKKSHEVEVLSAIAAAVSQISNISHLIDIGDGKGYLSSMLALHHQIPVLGVDASTVNTCGAQKRATKLSRVWKGISKAPKKSVPAKNDDTTSSDVNLYKQITKFVDKDFDFQREILDVYEESICPERLGLVGLHTCGNLASNSLSIFTNNDYVKSICNVGCCYHLIDEKFENTDLKNTEFGFPMSKYLTDKKIALGRSARMIANQSVDRILANKELPNKTIYYRAVLQVLFEKYCQSSMPTKHVGKFRKECEDFVDYATKAMKRVGVNSNITIDEIRELSKIYDSRIDELNIFYLIRCRLAPVIESLILLDRMLFLFEKNYENAFLVQLFDPVISPRCYGIVVFKEIL